MELDFVTGMTGLINMRSFIEAAGATVHHTDTLHVDNYEAYDVVGINVVVQISYGGFVFSFAA